MQVAISTVAYDGYPLETALRSLGGMGVTVVEPAYIAGYMDFDETAFGDAAAAALRAGMAANGLSAVAVSAHLDLAHPDATAMLARRIRHTAAIGALFTLTNSADTAQRDAVLRVLDACLPLAAELGIVIGLENPGHGTGSMIPDGRQGVALVAGIDTPHVRLNYDIGNVLTYSEGALPPLADMPLALTAAAHVHLKDPQATAAGWAYGVIGEGALDLPPLLTLLRARPDLPVTLELPLRLQRRRGGMPERARPPLTLAAIEAAIAASVARIASPEPVAT